MRKALVLLSVPCFIALSAHAAEGLSIRQSAALKQLLSHYSEKAKLEARESESKERRNQVSFTVEAGRKFYLTRRTWESHDYTCSGCHTDDPKKEGKHIDTDKPIKPLAPSVNHERFTDAQKIEKNFTKHCMDLYQRECRAYEKGNFITYLMSL